MVYLKKEHNECINLFYDNTCFPLLSNLRLNQPTERHYKDHLNHYGPKIGHFSTKNWPCFQIMQLNCPSSKTILFTEKERT